MQYWIFSDFIMVCNIEFYPFILTFYKLNVTL